MPRYFVTPQQLNFHFLSIRLQKKLALFTASARCLRVDAYGYGLTPPALPGHARNCAKVYLLLSAGLLASHTPPTLAGGCHPPWQMADAASRTACTAHPCGRLPPTHPGGWPTLLTNTPTKWNWRMPEPVIERRKIGLCT